MARRNQNTFLKRQKEIERMRKAKEKMDRRHGKKKRDDEPAEALSPQEHSPDAFSPDEATPDQEFEGGLESDDSPAV